MELTQEQETQLAELKQMFKTSFGRLKLDEEKTIEFYFKLGYTRGVDGYLYVKTAIERASFKGSIDKPISYIASLCKNYYKKGLYSQASQDEDDIIRYVESRIGKISQDNANLIKSAISVNGTVRVMASAAEILNNSTLQDKIIEQILVHIVEIFGRDKG